MNEHSTPDSAPPPDYILRLPQLERPARWPAIFGAERPTHLEIGFGSGHWLAEYARLHPELNLLGIEKTLREVRRCADKLRRRGVENVRLLQGYAEYFLANYSAEASLDTIHLYFPDPWPKARHARRRIFRPDVIRLIARALRPGAQLLVKTDVTEYYKEMIRVAAREPALRLEEDLQLQDGFPRTEAGALAAYDPALHGDLPECLRLTTNYERKAIEDGRPIHFMRWVRIP